MKDFDPNDNDANKVNPYHGILALTIQSKGNDNHAGSLHRGRGRPPITDISIEDMVEIDDPVCFSFFKSLTL